MPALPLLCVLGALLGGCGGGEGVASGATVSVYLGAPMRGADAATGRRLCAEAREELARAGGEAGTVRLRLVCLDSGDGTRAWTLARVGANARRAVEDSTTIAYVELPQPAPARFSHPILESADIAWIAASSGKTAMAGVLHAVEEADPSQLRESVREQLSSP